MINHKTSKKIVLANADHEYLEEERLKRKEENKRFYLSLAIRFIPIILFYTAVSIVAKLTDPLAMSISLIIVVALGVLAGFFWIPKTPFRR